MGQSDGTNPAVLELLFDILWSLTCLNISRMLICFSFGLALAFVFDETAPSSNSTWSSAVRLLPHLGSLMECIYDANNTL